MDTKTKALSLRERLQRRIKEARESELEKQKTDIYSQFAAEEPKVRQLIDLALLANGMLKGEALSEFVKRSVNLL